MVDTQSRYRMYGCAYNYQFPKKPVKTSRQTHRIVAAYTPQKSPPINHDCRADYLREFSDDHEWQAFIYSHGVRETTNAKKEIHMMPKIRVRPEKLLRSVGDRGSGQGQFFYPRSIAADSIGDFYVADAMNNRIQVFNGHGVFKFSIGEREDGLNLKEPSGIALFSNDDLAVADRKNKRIRILASDGSEKFDIETKDEPYSVACDHAYNIIVSTYAGTVELYRRGGAFYNRIKVSEAACPVLCNIRGEIIVSNVESKMIEFYDHTGKKLNQFKPVSTSKGLGALNAGVAVDSNGHILVCDSLNHTIDVYTDKGALLGRHIGPTDDLGSVQACAVGPQGHLGVVEYSSTGRHCLKIFRYSDCECHLYRKSPVDD